MESVDWRDACERRGRRTLSLRVTGSGCFRQSASRRRPAANGTRCHEAEAAAVSSATRCQAPLPFIFFVSPSYGPPPTAADQDEVRPDSNPSAKMERASRCKTVTPALPLATKAE